MEQEVFFSGYCRCMDASRMVEVCISDAGVEIDCSYENCPHTQNCTVAEAIRSLEK